MANSTANQISVGLQESLNLNTNKAEIKEFVGFNQRNSPFINGGISPIFKAEKTGSVIDKDGNVYKCENGNFYKNDVVIATGIEQQEFVRTKVDAPSDPNVKWCFDSAMNIFSAKVKEKSTTSIYSAKIEVSYKGQTYTFTTGFTNIQVGFLSNFVLTTQTGETRAGNKYLYVATWGTTDGTFHVFQDTEDQAISTLTPYFIDNFKSPRSSVNIQRVVVAYDNRIPVTITPVTGSAVTTYEEGWLIQTFDTEEYFCKANQSGSYLNILINKTINGNHITGAWENSSGGTTLDLYLVKEGAIGGAENPGWGIGFLYNARFKTGAYFYSTYKASVAVTMTSSTSYSTVTNPVPFTSGKAVENLPGTISDDDNYCFCDGETFYANGIINLNGKKVTVSHHDGVSVRIGEGCNAADSNGHYSSFSKNFCFVNENDMFTLLYNNNVISGISFNGILLTPFLDVKTSADFIIQRLIDSTITGSKNSQKKGIMYKSGTDNCFYTIFRKPQTNIQMVLLEDRYILMNTVAYYNGYDIKNNSFIHLCSDMNNRFLSGENLTVSLVASDINETPLNIASGINANYEIKMNPVVGAIFGSSIIFATLKNRDIKIDNTNLLDVMTRKTGSYLYKNNFLYSSFSGAKTTQFVDIYEFIGEEGNLPVYKYSYYLDGTITSFVIDKELIGVNYPVSTDGNIILSPSLFSTFFDSEIGADYIKDGRYYNLIYYEGIPLLAYYYGSGVANSEARFVIQGQSFIIRNGLIYSTTYNNGLMTVNDAIVNVDDLQFIGCVPMAAFFFSPATKCVLAFTGDRNLQTSFEATEMESVLTYKYVANNNSLYLATPSAVYVLYNTADGSSYIYKIDIADVSDFVALNDGSVALKVGTTWNILSFFEKENFETIPVKLTTCFYGAGLNRVSVIDCWYIRLFSNTAKKGKVKVKVETMTNISMSSEEQTFEISKEKWDENNNYIYLRYQPKLQRSVGCSLSIESDFAVYNLQCSVKPDSTIQVTKENGI